MYGRGAGANCKARAETRPILGSTRSPVPSHPIGKIIWRYLYVVGDTRRWLNIPCPNLRVRSERLMVSV